MSCIQRKTHTHTNPHLWTARQHCAYGLSVIKPSQHVMAYNSSLLFFNFYFLFFFLLTVLQPGPGSGELFLCSRRCPRAPGMAAPLPARPQASPPCGCPEGPHWRRWSRSTCGPRAGWPGAPKGRKQQRPDLLKTSTQNSCCPLLSKASHGPRPDSGRGDGARA